MSHTTEPVISHFCIFTCGLFAHILSQCCNIHGILSHGDLFIIYINGIKNFRKIHIDMQYMAGHFAIKSAACGARNHNFHKFHKYSKHIRKPSFNKFCQSSGQVLRHYHLAELYDVSTNLKK